MIGYIYIRDGKNMEDRKKEKEEKGEIMEGENGDINIVLESIITFVFQFCCLYASCNTG